MTWDRLPVLEHGGLRSGCPGCGPQLSVLDLESIIAVGFGDAGVTRDGTVVWREAEMGDVDSFDAYWTCGSAESVASKDPDHDWRIYYYGPLSEAVYQRQDGQWVLVETGRGFA